MKQYSIEFDFEGKNFQADVTEIEGLDDVQYVISTRDEILEERFKSNTLRKLKDEAIYQYAIPAVENGDEYMQALSKGLDQYIAKAGK